MTAAPHHATNFVKYTRDSIELILARNRKTSLGNDNIPYWIYRDCAHELSEVVTMLVNLSSIGLGVVSSAWRIAVITSIPKCTPVGGVNDPRLLSVTPILSRLMKRLIVRDHIYPAKPPNDIIDQYGFKPTGSTTAALVDLTNRI